MKVNCWFKEEGSVGLISTFISQLSWLGFHFLVWSGLRMMWRRVRHCQQFVYETWIYIYWKHGNNLVICWNSAYWTNYWLFELKPFISAKCYIYMENYCPLLICYFPSYICYIPSSKQPSCVIRYGRNKTFLTNMYELTLCRSGNQNRIRNRMKII